MANLRFTTEGQREALAAQESIAKKSRELKQEFEAGAKATKAWDADVAKMQRTSETALRSVQTEQEKIANQIADIQKAVENGLYEGREDEAAKALVRLRQKWVDVDEATAKAKLESRNYELQQERLKAAAESALGSVQTELERIEQQIEAVEQASKEGLIDADDAEKALERLRDQLAELPDQAKGFGDKVAEQLNKAFDPIRLVKIGFSVVGLKSLVDEVRATLDDLKSQMERRAATQEAAAKIGRGATAVYEGLPHQPFPLLGINAAQAAAAQAAYAPFEARLSFSEALAQGTNKSGLFSGQQVLSKADEEKLDALLADLGYSYLSRRFLRTMRGFDLDRDEAIDILEGAQKDIIQGTKDIATDYGVVKGQPLTLDQERTFGVLLEVLSELRKANQRGDRMESNHTDTAGIPVSAE